MKKKNNIIYDLFISHKQSNGGYLAMNIKLLLTNKHPNLSIYLDVDDLENIHDLPENVYNSHNLLLIITEGVFERPYVIKELETALKYKKNIIIVWDKNNCPTFPDKNLVPVSIRSILSIKAIPWISEKKFREVSINEILQSIKNENEKKIHLIEYNILIHLQDIGDIHKNNVKSIYSDIQHYYKRLEGFQLSLCNSIKGLSLKYYAHLEDIGDTAWYNEGDFCGTRNESRRLEGFAIELTGIKKEDYQIQYYAYLEEIGITQTYKNGEYCGTKGQNRCIEGIEIKILLQI
jgi:hypothetical protein